MISIRSISEADIFPQLNSSFCALLFTSIPSIKTRTWLASEPLTLICVCAPKTPLLLTAKPGTSLNKSLKFAIAILSISSAEIMVIAFAEFPMLIGINEAETTTSS